ncbi:MAG: hypothetical protein OEN23_18500 [Paracoccaceae bacterium]|nr:hypothetical protein [Paracoccaceae bacterium]
MLVRADMGEASPDQLAETRSRLLIWAAHLGLLVLTLVPVLSVEMAPLVDLPNHLARWHVLARLETEPLLQQSYRTISHLSPYLLVDLVTAPLVEIFGVYDAGRIFVAANMALIYVGVIAIHRALFTHFTLWPALALPVLYNHAFLWGFLNFYFGTALMLLCLGIWLRVQHWPVRTRIALLFAQCVLLYFAHILVLGLYGLVLFMHAFSIALRCHGRNLRVILTQIAPIAAPFLVMFAAFLVWFASDDVIGDKITKYGKPEEKLMAFLSPTLATEGFSDVVIFLALLGIAMVLLKRRMLRLAESMALPLIAVTVLCVAMPTQLLGVYGIDFRFPPILALLGVATTQPQAMSRMPRSALALAICLLVAGRAMTLWEPYQRADREFVEFRAAMAQLPDGARVLSSFDYVNGRMAMPLRSYWHWGSVAIIEANAFVPLLFTGVTQLRPTELTRDIDAPCGPIIQTPDVENGLDPDFIEPTIDFCGRFYWSEWPKTFDYLVRVNPVGLPDSFTPHVIDLESHGFFEVVRLRD